MVILVDNYIDRIVELAKIAYDNDDIPVGAIIVKDNEIVGEGFNTRNRFKSVIGHAEIDAIEMACKHIGDWRLDGAVMYVTLMPCMMCTGAIIESRIKKVYYLCDRTNVCFNSKDYLKIKKIPNSNRTEEYLELLQLFFENKRNKQ